MITTKIRNFIAGSLFWVPVMVLFSTYSAFSAAYTAPAENKIPVLRTKAGSYTNVTVTTKAANYIFIAHAQGLANIRVEDLTRETQEGLGYSSKAIKTAWVDLEAPVAARETQATATIPTEMTAEEANDLLEKQWAEVHSQIDMAKLRSLMFVLIGITAISYLFFCYCNMLICQKACGEAGILVWLPIFCFIPLLRAAGMSIMWFFALVLPPIAVALLLMAQTPIAFLVALAMPPLYMVVTIMWSINIVKARGKSSWVALWLILPVTSFFAYLYLAFSSAPPRKEEKLKIKALEFQAA